MINSSFKLPILVYHQVVPDKAPMEEIPPSVRPYCLSQGKFIAQFDYLYNSGYKSTAVSEIYGLKEKHAVGITFDDGLESDYSISFPELEKRGFTATFFIVTDKVGEKGHMNWEHIRELKSCNMEIGSHSVTHPCFLDIGEDVLLQELTRSKQVLEDRLGVSTESFSVPYGFVNQKIIETALEVGYKTICTSATRLVDTESIPRVYGRYGIRRGDTLRNFKGIVEKQLYTMLKIKLEERGKDFLKRFMGREKWLAFREKVLSRRTY